MKLSWLVTLLTATLLLEGREFRCAFPSASPYCSSECKHKPGPAPTLRALRDTRSSSQTSASPWLHASPQPCAFPRLCASPQPHAPPQPHAHTHPPPLPPIWQPSWGHRGVFHQRSTSRQLWLKCHHPGDRARSSGTGMPGPMPGCAKGCAGRGRFPRLPVPHRHHPAGAEPPAIPLRPQP